MKMDFETSLYVSQGLVPTPISFVSVMFTTGRENTIDHEWCLVGLYSTAVL